MQTVIQLPGNGEEYWLVVSRDNEPRIKSSRQYGLASVGLSARMYGTSIAWVEYLEDWLRAHKEPPKPSEAERRAWSAVRTALIELRSVAANESESA